MINRSCSRSPLIVLSVLLAISSLANAAQKTLSLYHAVNDGNFVKRGTVALDATTEEGLKMVVENDISVDAASIEAMVETGIYSLKIVDEKNDHAVMASVPACQLRRANFRDEITLTLGPRATVLSISYTPLVSSLAPRCSELSPPAAGEEVTFDSRISYETSTPGMTVPLVLPATKPAPGLKFYPQRGGDAPRPALDGVPGAEGAAGSGPESILKRYWYIILPMGLLALSGGGGEATPAEGQGEAPSIDGGSGGDGGAQRTAPAAGAPAPSGEGARRRRGKRS